MRKGAQELKDLDVDRVDGVDKPATGRNFLLFKSEDGDAIMKGYAMTATAGSLVLDAIRKDKHAMVSRKSAIALNGLAQVLGKDALFVSKSVPTQPYEFSEPDGDKRGPEDEGLADNFTPRSMPGSMVGRVQFRMKDEEQDEEDRKAKAKGPKMYDEDEDDAKGKGKAKAADKKDEDEEDRKGKAKARARKDDEADDDKDEDEMDGSERANRGIARAMDSLAKAVNANTDILKGLVGKSEKIQKSEEDKEEGERRPKSRQVNADETVRVRKSDGYTTRFDTPFENIVFGGK